MIKNGKPQKKDKRTSLIGWTIISSFVWIAVIMETAFVLSIKGGHRHSGMYIGCELPFLFFYIIFHAVFLSISWITWRFNKYQFNTVLMVLDVIVTGIYLVLVLGYGFLIGWALSM